MKITRAQKSILWELANGKRLVLDFGRAVFEGREWRTIKFKTLERLEAAGYLSCPRGESNYTLTDAGRAVVKRMKNPPSKPYGGDAQKPVPPKCVYCGKDKNQVTLTFRTCQCGKDHRTCRLCYKKTVKVVGMFPGWRAVLRACPKSIPVTEKVREDEKWPLG